MESQLHTLPQLHGQRVLITGAGGHLGAELAAVFAARGARVVAHARTQERATDATRQIAARVRELLNDSASQIEVHAAAADLADSAAAEQLVHTAAGQLKGLSGVINCAALQPVTEFNELNAAAWDTVLDANLRAAHLISRAAAAHLAPGGWITHIASIEGSRPAPAHSHYAVSKAALIMHARAAALELGQQGIRVNAVSPGLIARPGIDADWPEGVASWQQQAPLGRLVTGFDVAAACAFFASPAASAITGQNLAVDCGMLTTPGW